MSRGRTPQPPTSPATTANDAYVSPTKLHHHLHHHLHLHHHPPHTHKHTCARARSTFKPNLESKQRRVSQPAGPVVVRGLGRYLELRNMAAKQKAEKEDLEQAVYRPRGGGRPIGGVTKPKPFNLSSSRDPHRKARIAAEALEVSSGPVALHDPRLTPTYPHPPLHQAENEACTFAPRTNETGGRAVVNLVMTSETTSNG